MYFLVKKFGEKITLIDKESKKQTILQAYSFVNESGLCMIIAYGEDRRDFLIKVFEELKKSEM